MSTAPVAASACAPGHTEAASRVKEKARAAPEGGAEGVAREDAGGDGVAVREARALLVGVAQGVAVQEGGGLGVEVAQAVRVPGGSVREAATVGV